MSDYDNVRQPELRAAITRSVRDAKAHTNRRFVAIGSVVLVLVALVSFLVLQTNQTNEQIEARMMVLETVINMPTSTSTPTATPTVIPPVVPTQTPMPEVGYKIVAAANREYDAFYFTGEVKEDLDPMEQEAASSQLQKIFTDVVHACDRPGGWNSWNQGSTSVGAYADEDIPETCFQEISKWGTVTETGVPKSILPALEAFQASPEDIEPGINNSLLFLDRNEGVIGKISSANRFPTFDEACLLEALNYIGWSGNTDDLFALNRQGGGDEPWKILFQNAADNAFWMASEIPDFCGGSVLHEVVKPDWLTAKWSNDAFIMTKGELEVRIHTDASICDQYPGGFASDVYLVEMLHEGEAIPVVTMSPSTLLEVRAEGLGSVLVLVRDKNVKYYDTSTAWADYKHAAAVMAIENMDGMGPGVYLNYMSPYKLDGEVFDQKFDTVE